MKPCPRCKLDKPLDSFGIHHGEKDGHQTYCRECSRRFTAESRDRRKLNPFPPTMVGTKICTMCKKDKPVTDYYIYPYCKDGRSYRCGPCADKATMASNAKRAKGEIYQIKRKWYLDHRDLGLARAKKYWMDHPDFQKAWRKNSPEKARLLSKQSSNRRRAHKLNAPINDFTKEEWKLLLVEFGNVCYYCKKGNLPLTLDHVIPLSKGGSHTYSNIVPACKSCNCRKQARPVELFLRELNNQPETLPEPQVIGSPTLNDIALDSVNNNSV